ncbi:hypothetical protein Unana1_07757 [Umbelopsis nana]
MRLKSFGAILLATSAFAKNSTYNVVTLDTNSTRYGVLINNTVYFLSQSSKSPLLYTGEAPAGSPYRYCILDSFNKAIGQEVFSRPSLNNDSSLNEVYNRSHNFVDIPALPQLWNSSYNADFSGTLHTDGQIAVIHIQAKESEIEAMHNNVTADTTVVGNLTFISPTDIKYVDSIELKLAGRSSRIWPKQSYTLDIKKNGGDLYGLTKFKLRAEPTDPTYMREKMYYDFLKRSVGVPANGASWVRVLLNGRPAGFYLLIDQPDKTWLAATYNGKDGGSDTGILYMGNFGAPSYKTPMFIISDLSYLGDNQSVYASNETYKVKEKSSDKKDIDFTKLIALTKDIANSQSYDVKKWTELFDVDVYLKSMAMEFFQGHMDGYLGNSNNFLVYQNKNQWTWLSSDLDYSMGNMLSNQSNLRTGDYTQYANTTRPLLSALLEVTEFNTTYRDYITKIAQQLYSLDILSPRIESFKTLIKEDVDWDVRLPKLSKGFPRDQSAADKFGIDYDFDMNSGIITLPGGGIQIDMYSYEARMNATNITFENSIEGETGYKSLYGLKQWIRNKETNTKDSLGLH